MVTDRSSPANVFLWSILQPPSLIIKMSLRDLSLIGALGDTSWVSTITDMRKGNVCGICEIMLL